MIKKFLFIILFILLLTGICWAASIFSKTLASAGTGFQNYSLRSVMSAANIPDASYTSFRVSFQASTSENTLYINAAYLGESVGGASSEDFKTSPAKVQLLFSGGGTATITAGNTLYSDWVTFSSDGTVDLLVSMDTGDNNYVSNVTTGGDGAGYKSGADAVNNTTTMNYWSAVYTYIINAAEATAARRRMIIFE